MMLHGYSAANRGGGGQQAQFAPCPQCKGAPKQCQTCSNRIRSSVTFQSNFFKGLVLLYFRLKSACSFALRFMLLMQILNAQLSYVATAQSASRALYVVLFDLKPLIEDGNLHAGIYVLCASTKKSLRSPQNTLQSM